MIERRPIREPLHADHGEWVHLEHEGAKVNWLEIDVDDVPVPATAIWTSQDGVVPGRVCRQSVGPEAENVEVRGTHLGLGTNAAAMLVIAIYVLLPQLTDLPRMLEAIRSADLIVLGQPHEEGYEPATDSLIGDIALSAGLPVLAVPRVGQYDTVGKNILLAWTRRRESTRVVREALPLLAKGFW